MITTREDAILGAAEHHERLNNRCKHHAAVIDDPELTAAMADLDKAIARIRKAARATRQLQGATPITPDWWIGEGAVGK